MPAGLPSRRSGLCALLVASLAIPWSAIGAQASSFHDVYELVDVVTREGLQSDVLLKRFADHGIAWVVFDGMPWSHEASHLVLLDGTRINYVASFTGTEIAPPNFVANIDDHTCVSAWGMAGRYRLNDAPTLMTAPEPTPFPSTEPPRSAHRMSGKVGQLTLSVTYWTLDSAPRSDGCVEGINIDE